MERSSSGTMLRAMNVGGAANGQPTWLGSIGKSQSLRAGSLALSSSGPIASFIPELRSGSGSLPVPEAVRSRLASIFQGLVVMEDGEMEPLIQGATSYFFCLASFFILQPLRDNTAITLGPQSLPYLFVIALVATAIVSPAVAGYIVSRTQRRSGAAVLEVFRGMSIVTIGFYLAFTISDLMQQRRGPVLVEDPHADLLDDGPEAGVDRMQQAGAALQLLTSWAFYVWVTLQNVLATTTLWSRVADVFTPDSGSRLFGLIGAGATVGQLFGSLIAGFWASLVGRYSVLQLAGGMNQLLLVAALFTEMAGLLLARVTPMKAARDLPGSHQRSGLGLKSPEKPQQRGNSLLTGVRLILSSHYLCHLCAYLLTNSFVSSMFYFVKTLVVADSHMGSSSRTAFFAGINSFSALIIVVLQLGASGRILHGIGIPFALAFTPGLLGFMMFAVSLHPLPWIVAGADVVRRLATYVVSRPAREVLFTVVSREEKYKAKAIIDTVVLRLGDTSAAAVMSLLDSTRGDHLEPSLAAMVACSITVLWAALGFSLGRRQQRMAANANALVA